MLVAHKGVGGLLAEIEVDAANGEVHRRQPPCGGVGFLAIDRHVADLAAVRFDELFALHKHAARAAAGVIHLAVVRREHRNQGLDDEARRVELPAALAFGAGELAEEILVDLPQQIAGVVFGRVAGLAKADFGDQIDQFAQLAIGQLHAGVAFVEDAFELGVFGFDQRQRIVDAFADVGLLGLGAQGFPAGGFGHPEDVDFLVIVAVFQFFGQHRRISVV